MSCPRLRFFMRAPSNWLGVGTAYVGVAAPLPITDPFSGVPPRIALGALIDLPIMLFTYRASPEVDSIWFCRRMAVSIQSTGNALWHNDLQNCRD
ncbi:hypothetical protein ALC60_03829 [Trachymyrmex zeteki]|uniref:Uncharacterized protein n=1 Tax=Mycetomoellerius zeteki TaxID=64791 RepID=A0A151X9X7_9HYME|nr:hypothetical protein ALC60_03829 [Trachymyrmex zeteki]